MNKHVTTEVNPEVTAEWNRLIQQVREIPYGRIEDHRQVLNQKRGTCSTKHAFLKHKAEDMNLEHIKLLLVLYKMNDNNTPGVGPILKKYNLDFVPEAHCVLFDTQQGDFIDATFEHSDFDHLISDTLLTIQINPEDIYNFKKEWHKKYIGIFSNNSEYSAQELWEIREACIQALTQNEH